MPRKDKIYLWARGLILPLATLLPFLVTKMYTVSCQNDMTGVSSVYQGPSEQCVGMRGPSLVTAILIAVGLVAVIVVSLLKIEPKGREKMRHFIARQFALTAAVALATSLLYLLMRNYSQGENFYKVTFSPDGRLLSEGTALFGLGISPSTFLLLLSVYLIMPILRWYKVIFSRQYVDGQKKQELFQ